MAVPPTYNEQQREAIVELAIGQQMPYVKVQATLAAGYANLEPFRPSTSTISAIANQARPAILDEEPSAALDQLTRRSLATIEQYVQRIERQPGNFDPDDMLKIMRTLVEAKGLVQPKREKDEGKGNGTLGHLSSVPTTRDSANMGSPADSPVTTHVTPAA
jgi:hypothetical protein